MNRALLPIAVVVAVLLVIVVFGSPFYIVTEREQAVVTRFNKPVRVIVGDAHEDFEALREEISASIKRVEAPQADVDPEQVKVSQGAGLYMRMPFVDVVETFPDTIIEYDVDPEDIVTEDKKKLVVDNYAQWRILNPLLFRIRVRTENAAASSLDDIIYSIMREELGKSELVEIIRTTKNFDDFDSERVEEIREDALLSNAILEDLDRGREEIMKAVTSRTNEIAQERYGIEVLDVRIKRAELVPENLQAVFARMRAERERISKGYRSEGEKEANIIRGDTDREVAILLAEAKAEGERLRGAGDAEAIRVYAEAFGQDPELYQFLRSLEVIKEATPTGSELIVGLDSSIYNLLKTDDLSVSNR